MEAGETFKRSYGVHLWVVVSDPAKDSQRVLIVNMTTVRNRFHDPACVLNAGDHREVKHQTYMNYRDSRIVRNSALEAQLSTGQIAVNEKVSECVLDRIRRGAASSDYIPMAHRELLVEQGLAEP